MQTIDQATFEMFAKDQGDKFRTILSLVKNADDSNWSVILDKIRSISENGLAYLVHFDDHNPQFAVITNDY